MNVNLRILFAPPPTPTDWKAMKSIGQMLTNDRASVRVQEDPRHPNWLVPQFTMQTKRQHEAAPRVESAVRLCALNRGHASG
jgi:hypothetical protein